MDDVTDTKQFLADLDNQDDAMVRWQRLRQRSNGDDGQQRAEQAKQERQGQERELAAGQQNNNAAYWKQLDDRIYECIRLWAENRFSGYADLWGMRQFKNVWRDVFGRILAQERKSIREQVAAATTKMQARFDELETLFWTQWQTAEKRHTEAMEQIGERMAALEGALAETRGGIDDIKREVTEGTKRVGDLESAYWGHREAQSKEITDKLTAFARQVDDVAHELVAVRHALENARDTDERFRILEQGLAARQIALVESVRGPKGLTGKQGPKGERGAPGKDGKDGRVVSLKTRRWEVDVERSTAREVLSDGARMPAINLRPVLESFTRDLDLRVESRVEERIAQAIRSAMR